MNELAISLLFHLKTVISTEHRNERKPQSRLGKLIQGIRKDYLRVYIRAVTFTFKPVQSHKH